MLMVHDLVLSEPPNNDYQRLFIYAPVNQFCAIMITRIVLQQNTKCQKTENRQVLIDEIYVVTNKKVKKYFFIKLQRKYCVNTTPLSCR